MIQINIDKIEKLIKTHQKEIDEINKVSLEKLRQLKDNNYLGNKERQFVRKILYHFKDVSLISLNFNSMNDIKNKIGEAPRTKKRVFTGKTKKSCLKDEIINVLGYNKLRATFFPKFFKGLGIKSCIYCNTQLTLTIDKGKNDYKANYQLDHYNSKDKLPYLCISLYNLYPVCASCNLTKSNKKIDFQLYTDEIDYNLFKFEIQKESKAKFLVSRKIDDLKIKFIKKNDSSYDKVFKITEIYDTQKDIVEEIILKSLIYTESYRKDLKDISVKEKISDSLIDRFILGNYTNPDEIHKRPMSKLMQDIGREMGLIK